MQRLCQQVDGKLSGVGSALRRERYSDKIFQLRGKQDIVRSQYAIEQPGFSRNYAMLLTVAATICFGEFDTKRGDFSKQSTFVYPKFMGGLEPVPTVSL